MLMNTDLKILETRTKDSDVFPSKAELTLWREIQHGTETPNGNRDAKRGSSGSMAAENPSIRDVFSVQQLLSIPAAM